MTFTGTLNVGDKVAAFVLPDQALNNIALPIPGKKTLLAFFPVAFSGGPETGCECNMRTLDEELPIFTELGVFVVGISRGLPPILAAWHEKINLHFPLLSDPNLEIAGKFIGTMDLGSMIDLKYKTRGLSGYQSSNRGIIVMDEKGIIIYKYISLNEAGQSDPRILPNIELVKKAITSLSKL